MDWTAGALLAHEGPQDGGDDCVTFCERWDQSSFDPGFDTLPLEHFAPLVHEVFARKAYDPAILRPGAREPLTAG